MGAVTLSMTYPGLYQEADGASNRQQRLFMDLIKIEYFFLFIAALFSLDIFDYKLYYITYALVFVVPFAALLVRSFLKPEQGWYQARALAESIKTSTWKYAMRAKPFEGAEAISIPHAEFRNHLKQILRANRHVGRQFDSSSAHLDQITPEMDNIRSLDAESRLRLYVRNRIDDQRSWYARKARLNRTWSIRTIVLLCAIYFVAALTLLIRVAEPTWRLSHPEPLIAVATALIGWSQIKKFNELATAYGLTAHEIGILRTETAEAMDDEKLSNFVDDAEQAFSREHTQWIARQST